MMRKVIQVSTTSVSTSTPDHEVVVVVALCDDGTMWRSNGGQAWVQLPNVP